MMDFVMDVFTPPLTLFFALLSNNFVRWKNGYKVIKGKGAQEQKAQTAGAYP